MHDYYKILQVQPDAEAEVIQAAYHRLSQKYHPDTNNSPDAHEKMSVINEAYEVLSDPIKRSEYDRKHTRFTNTSVKDESTQRIAAELALPRLRNEIQTLELEIQQRKQQLQSFVAHNKEIQPKRFSDLSFFILLSSLCAIDILVVFLLFSDGPGGGSFIVASILTASIIGIIVYQKNRSQDVQRLAAIEQQRQEELQHIRQLQVILDSKMVEYRHYQSVVGAL